MATSSDGIGKDPEEVDASLPTDEQVLAHLESQTESASASDAGDGDDLPSREDLYHMIQAQQDQMNQMAQRIDHLEQQVEEVEYEASTVEEVADQLESGKIGGEAGAEFIQQFIEVPDHSSMIDARTTQVFLRIIRENRVGTPVTSTDIVKWIGLEDSANPSVQAKRIMDRMVENRDDGFYIGSIELKKHRGKNAIWLGE